MWFIYNSKSFLHLMWINLSTTSAAFWKRQSKTLPFEHRAIIWSTGNKRFWYKYLIPQKVWRDYIQKVPVILHNKFHRECHNTYGPPTSVTWLQLLCKQTNIGTSNSLTTETHRSTRTRLGALSRLATSAYADTCDWRWRLRAVSTAIDNSPLSRHSFMLQSCPTVYLPHVHYSDFHCNNFYAWFPPPPPAASSMCSLVSPHIQFRRTLNNHR